MKRSPTKARPTATVSARTGSRDLDETALARVVGGRGGWPDGTTGNTNVSPDPELPPVV